MIIGFLTPFPLNKNVYFLVLVFNIFHVIASPHLSRFCGQTGETGQIVLSCIEDVGKCSDNKVYFRFHRTEMIGPLLSILLWSRCVVTGIKTAKNMCINNIHVGLKR